MREYLRHESPLHRLTTQKYPTQIESRKPSQIPTEKHHAPDKKKLAAIIRNSFVLRKI